MKNQLYYKQWLQLKISQSPSKNCDCILQTNPNNIFQLNFWLDALFITKIKTDDIPNQSIFYLQDKSYQQIINKLADTNKAIILYKIELLQLVLGMSINSGFSSFRQELQQCAIIAINKPQISQTHSSISLVWKQHLEQKTNFTLSFVSELIAEYIEKQNILKISSKKSLNEYDDISMVNIFMKHIFKSSGNKSQNKIRNSLILSCIKNFIIDHRKDKVISLMKDNIIKTGNGLYIQFLLEIVTRLNLQRQIFTYPSLIGKNSVKSTPTDSQILYKIYTQQLQGNNFIYMPYFQSFMNKYLAAKTFPIFSTIKVSHTQQNCVNNIRQALDLQEISLLNSIKKYPLILSKKCLEYYLWKSDFKNPYQNKLTSIKSTNPKHIPLLFDYKEVCDPFLFFPIYQIYWNHTFHSQILNRILWIILQQWFLYIESQAQHISGRNSSQFEQYKKNYILTMIQFMLGYKVGIFLKHYPSQIGIINQISRLQSFSQLVLSNKQFLFINWIDQCINNDCQIICSQKRGIQLIYQYTKNKKDSLQISLVKFLYALMERKLYEQNRKVQQTFLIKILQELCLSWKYSDYFAPLKQKYLDKNLRDAQID